MARPGQTSPTRDHPRAASQRLALLLNQFLGKILKDFWKKFHTFLALFSAIFEQKLQVFCMFFHGFFGLFSWFFTQIFHIFADFLPAGYERSYLTEWTLNARPADQFLRIFRRFFRVFSALFRNLLAKISEVFSRFFCTFGPQFCRFSRTFWHLFFA